MATKDDVRDLALRGMSYEEIGLAMGLSPGLAYMIATGVPADGSGALSPEDRSRPGLVPGSTQHLSNPPTAVPGASGAVCAWMVATASEDAQMVAAGRGSRGSRTRRYRNEGRASVPPPDVLSVLRRDHNEIHSILQELSSLPAAPGGGSPEDLSPRSTLMGTVIERLSAHEAAEAGLFWPAVADTVDGGASMADLARAQEKSNKRLLANVRRLDKLDKGAEHLGDLVDELVVLVRKHVAFEDAVFTKVADQVSDEDRRRLGARMRDLLGRSVTARPRAMAGAGARPTSGATARGEKHAPDASMSGGRER